MRNNSSRLPRKVIKKINDKTIMEYLLERVRRCKNVDNIIVCTTTDAIDDSICDICEKNKIRVYRGKENDVLNRYYQAAFISNADIIVRVTGDCPLIDPNIIDEIIVKFRSSECDYMDCYYHGKTKGASAGFPDGSNPEIFSFKALECANENAETDHDKEHVTGYISSNLECEKYTIPLPDEYKSINFEKLHLSLDTPQDFELIQTIIRDIYNENNQFTIYDVLRYLDNKNIKE